MPVNLGVNVTIDLEDVRPAVIVEIDKSASPSDILIIDSYPRRKRDITECAVRVVVIEVASVVREVRLEDI